MTRPFFSACRLSPHAWTVGWTLLLAATILAQPAANPAPWSFEPLTHQPLPATGDPWLRNGVDSFILAGLKGAGLAPSEPAHRADLIRRMTLDLHGLPPTPRQRAAFLADESPDATDRLADRLLASPRHGERWASHWLDVVRFAQTHGFETNTPRPNAWRYRDWVIESMNRDEPYDRFILQQIAGDGLAADVATGFLVTGPWDEVKSPDIVLTLTQREDELAGMVNTTSTAFLGLTVACARCHDHKFDPITQADYYAMQAVFAGVGHGDRPIRTPETLAVQRQVQELQREIASLKSQLEALAGPVPTPARLILLDDEMESPGVGVRILQPLAGHGENPPGVGRGYRDDPGAPGRMPNLSRGRYSWWESKAGLDLMAYHPGAQGLHHLWVSWGCGWDTHATDVQWILDGDGDPATRQDQRVLAVVDQQGFSDGGVEIQQKPLWSGLKYLGWVELTPAAAILVRAGATPRPVTADVIVLEEASGSEPSTGLPRLRPPVDPGLNEDRFKPEEVRFLRLSIEQTNSGSEPCLDELEVYTADVAGSAPRNVALTSAGALATVSGEYPGDPRHVLAHLNDGRYGNDRSWISNEAGRGWAILEFSSPVVIDRVLWGRDREGRYRDRTPTQYRIDVASVPGQWRMVASSHDRAPAQTPGDPLVWRILRLGPEESSAAQAIVKQMTQLQEQLKALQQNPTMAYAGTFQNPPVVHLLHRGDPLQPKQVIGPEAIGALRGQLGSLGLAPESTEQARRMALARWIASTSNPLSWRVIVNRIWQGHFGHGIVETPSDFGAMGAPPSHPELLDWLARSLLRRGGSLKQVHRLLLTSATYAQSSAGEAQGLAVDAGTRLLWRWPLRRLDAEPIHDSILAVAGSLDQRMGGVGYDMFMPNDNYVRVYNPKEAFGAGEWRRMVYQYKVRMQTDAVFGSLDVPDAGQSCPRRGRSTTAIQALALFHSPFMIQQSQLFAQRLRREAGPDPGPQVHQGFMLALGRAPSPQESAEALDLVAAAGLENFCRAILNANEFLFIP